MNLQTGEYIQRIGEVVLDGSEDWRIYNDTINPDSYTNNYRTFFVIERQSVGILANCQLYSDKYRTYIEKPKGITEKGFVYAGSSNLNVVELANMTVDEFKEKISLNPITVQYPLATPIVKQIDINNFPHSYKDGHVVIESNDPSTNVTAQMTYQSVANRTGQFQEHTEQVEKQEHEINELEMLILENIRQQQNR